MPSKKIYLISVFLFLTNTSFSQPKPYILEGSIKKIRTGKVYLLTDFSSNRYYKDIPIIDSANIKNGIFSFSLKKYSKYPTMYRLFIKSRKIAQLTGSVFIEQKNRKIIVDSINEYVAPIIINNVHQEELKSKYEPFFKNLVEKNKILEDKIDELYNIQDTLSSNQEEDFNNKKQSIYQQGDSMLLNYIKLNPSSSIALWKLIERINNFGYRDIYSDCFNLLKDKVKHSPTGIILAEEMHVAEKILIGKHFPQIMLNDSSDNTVLNVTERLNSKFTLVDFWFSHCAPCIREFTVYKSMFPYFQQKGLNIISVSTDDENAYLLWKQTLKKLDLPWQQLWDKNGVNAKSLLITSYPTNYLLNEKGVIIAKNISVSELKAFLND